MRSKFRGDILVPNSEIYIPYPVCGWLPDALDRKPEQALEVTKFLAEGFYEDAEGVPLAGLLFARKSPTQAPRNTVWSCTVRRQSKESHAALIKYVRALVGLMDVRAVCWLTESWFSPLVEVGSHEDAEIEAYKAAHGGSVEGCPGAWEGLLAQVETLPHVYQAIARIQRDEKGRGKLEPWYDPGCLIQVGDLAGMFNDIVTVTA